MVLCELPTDNFLITWATLTALGIVSLFAFSGSLFYYSYVQITYEKWVRRLFFETSEKKYKKNGNVTHTHTKKNRYGRAIQSIPHLKRSEMRFVKWSRERVRELCFRRRRCIWLERDIPRPFATRREDTLTICSRLYVSGSVVILSNGSITISDIDLCSCGSFTERITCFSIPVLSRSSRTSTWTCSSDHLRCSWFLFCFRSTWIFSLEPLRFSFTDTARSFIGDTKRLGWTRTIRSSTRRSSITVITQWAEDVRRTTRVSSSRFGINWLEPNTRRNVSVHDVSRRRESVHVKRM